MRIGIVPYLNPLDGGVYQYSLTLLRTLHQAKLNDQFVVFSEGAESAELLSCVEGWEVMPLQPPSTRRRILDLRRIIGEGPHREAWRWLRSQTAKRRKTKLRNPEIIRLRPEMRSWFQRCGIELMVYPTCNSLSFETGLPYVMTIHDLQHRLQPQFPEVSANGEWEWREYRFRNGTRYATLLLADSEVGKEDILNFYGSYGVTPERVKVLPTIPACYLSLDVAESERRRIRVTYSLPEKYIFYPAQFWPHKNHIRIVQALGFLKQVRQLKIPVVFCGSYQGEIRESVFREVMALSSELGISEEIRYLGYVPNEDMSGLYAGAAALVMPTFFGPTNIPVWEAWAIGCPVLTSDIRGIREQAGDAALLADPTSVEAIAEGIHRLWTDQEFGRMLADLGRRRLSMYTPEDYLDRIVNIIKEAKERVRFEKQPLAKVQDR